MAIATPASRSSDASAAFLSGRPITPCHGAGPVGSVVRDGRERARPSKRRTAANNRQRPRAGGFFICFSSAGCRTFNLTATATAVGNVQNSIIYVCLVKTRFSSGYKQRQVCDVSDFAQTGRKYGFEQKRSRPNIHIFSHHKCYKNRLMEFDNLYFTIIVAMDEIPSLEIPQYRQSR